MGNKEISENAQKHILKKKDIANNIGVWKGLKYSKAIHRILCRKCLSRVLKEFGGERPNPENPQLYCNSCRQRLEKLTKDTYEAI